MEKNAKRILLFLVFALVFAMGFTTSADFAQDLGRHLKLGEIITRTGALPGTNLFSYSNPDYPFMNHHWFSEVIFFTLEHGLGLGSLIWLKVVLTLLAVSFVLKAAVKKAGVLTVCAVSFVLLPLLAERLDVRPELFGYLFFSMTVYILFFQQNKQWLYLVPFIMLLWVNLHITFVFGLVLIGVYALFNARRHTKEALSVSLMAFSAVCLNPHGIAGALYPFNIFGNYGYSIAENQNMFFLSSITSNPFIRYFFFTAPLIVLAFIVLLSKKKFAFAVLLGIFFILPFWQIRHLPFFVFASIPPVSYAYSLLFAWTRRVSSGRWEYVRRYGGPAVVVAGFLITYLFASNTLYRMFDRNKSFGYGFTESQSKAADFILSSRLPGRLFNNFDIGGYAIYRLYPQYRVFVDNRPEAYPASFFRDVYVKLQEDDGVRKKVFAQYGIHTVFFAYTDATPWGSSFLSHILDDPAWKLVFLNDTVVVLTDAKGWTDLRGDRGYMDKLVNETDGYGSLMNLAAFFGRINRQDLVQGAFSKAVSLNPSSCSITRALYREKLASPYFDEAENLRKSSWWCF